MKVKELLNENFVAPLQLESITPTGETASQWWNTVAIKVLSQYGNLEASAFLDYISESTGDFGERLLHMFGDKWSKILDVLQMEYNPLWNVDAKETTTHSGSDDHIAGTSQTRTDNLTDELTHGKTTTTTHADTDTRTLNTSDSTTYGHTQTRTHADTDTRTLNTSDSTTYGRTETATHYISGDNGGEVESGRDVTGNSGTDTTQHTGTDALARTGTVTDADTGTDTTQHTGTDALARTGTVTDADSGKDTRTNTGTQTTANSGKNTDEWGHIVTLVRQGNIGTTSSQDLLTAELSVRKNIYMDIVVDDIKHTACGCIWG